MVSTLKNKARKAASTARTRVFAKSEPVLTLILDNMHLAANHRYYILYSLSINQLSLWFQTSAGIVVHVGSRSYQTAGKFNRQHNIGQSTRNSGKKQQRRV